MSSLPLIKYLTKSLCYALFLGITACASSKTSFFSKHLRSKIESNPIFTQSYCGVVLYDLLAQKTVYSYNGDRYFAPASNTKIFTLYTCLRMLGDSVPALKYVIRHDSLILWGTGDPSFLHPNLAKAAQADRVCHWLSQRKETLCYASVPYEGAHFGPGWAWDDYNDAYSPEKAAFPIYANIVRFGIRPGSTVQVQPHFFASNLTVAPGSDRGTQPIRRSLASNTFTLYTDRLKAALTQDVPFKYSTELVRQLLHDTLHREVASVQYSPVTIAQSLYSLPTDSLYKRMMQESDNFLAEQLLLVCSSTLSDTLSSVRTIAYAKQHFFADLPDKLVWVDGSGLSRYNLFTPRTIVALWRKLYAQIPRERLFGLLAVNGKSGTLKNFHLPNGPFIYGKSGSFSNNHALSGFLVAKSGRVLVFSFMNSNFVLPTAEIRQEKERILTEIYLNY
ncbi:MAG: D-alanyl-D-alanine carboxypeptidase [Bacteroidota bacterium]